MTHALEPSTSTTRATPRAPVAVVHVLPRTTFDLATMIPRCPRNMAVEVPEGRWIEVVACTAVFDSALRGDAELLLSLRCGSQVALATVDGCHESLHLLRLTSTSGAGLHRIALSRVPAMLELVMTRVGSATRCPGTVTLAVDVVLRSNPAIGGAGGGQGPMSSASGTE